MGLVFTVACVTILTCVSCARSHPRKHISTTMIGRFYIPGQELNSGRRYSNMFTVADDFEKCIRLSRSQGN
jgi:hypothetical protein